MKKITLTHCFLFVFIGLFAQGNPDWLSENVRALRYPNETYYTGFVYSILEQGKSLPTLIESTKANAQAELVKKIRLKVEAKTQNTISSQNSNGKYNESESFQSDAKITSDAEIVGVNTDWYHNKTENIVYAFAYVNKNELIGYYKSNLSVNISQIESFIKTAKDLEAQKEKAKARQQLELAKPFFSKLRYAQDLLIAIDGNISAEDLQQTKVETLYSQIAQMQAQWAQSIHIYVESVETNFSKPTTVLGNQVKATLSKNGCTITEKPVDIDFQLSIKAETRNHSTDRGFNCCYADVEIILKDSHKKKIIFQDEFSQKGISTSQESAGRKALEDAVSVVIEKIIPLIENNY